MSKVFLSGNEVRKIIEKALKRKLARDCKIYLADGEYYAPPKRDVERILEETHTDAYKWTAGTFDCDDFAKVLCAEFAKDAYRNGIRRPPYCLGFVWGLFPRPHAINWFIDNENKLYLIEPQTDFIFKPRRSDKGIWLIVA